MVGGGVGGEVGKRLFTFTVPLGPSPYADWKLRPRFASSLSSRDFANPQPCTWKIRTSRLWAVVILMDAAGHLHSLSAFLLPGPWSKAIKKSNKIMKPHFRSMHSGQKEIRLSLQNIYNWIGFGIWPATSSRKQAWF